MSLSIAVADADKYFQKDNHIMSGPWLSFESNIRKATVAQATRIITRVIGYDVADEAVITEPVNYRPDYAVFEQALFMLLNSSAVPDGTRAGPKYVSSDPNSSNKVRGKEDLGDVCEEAARWLIRPRKNILLVRG